MFLLKHSVMLFVQLLLEVEYMKRFNISLNLNFATLCRSISVVECKPIVKMTIMSPTDMHGVGIIKFKLTPPMEMDV